ncbi:hypothetical protein B0H63DRAFT_197542 [Podospora didyma]|uniref:Uncharacterized protein n=1 Tax=Podospora didyma TaxID=330526 RepID=A0AAE0NGR8_9PEZI|nr:hypothetical protein B0H63DRAFT_197542 [Podospora didyma]
MHSTNFLAITMSVFTAISPVAAGSIARESGLAATNLFAKRDICTGKACNSRADCEPHGCDNGCNTNGKCHQQLFYCRACKVNRREDGSLFVVDGDLNQAIGRVELVEGFVDEEEAEDKEDAAAAAAAVSAGSLFAKRDICTGKSCNSRADCEPHGCDNGCNTNGKCHQQLPGFCRSCEINKREDGTIVVVKRTGEVIGHVIA